MKITVQNEIYCKTKNIRFKLRHAPYLNRVVAYLKKNNETDNFNIDNIISSIVF